VLFLRNKLFQTLVAFSIVNVRNEDNDSGDVGGDKESGFFGGCRVVEEG
jgi:hypothetical protein